MSSAALALQGLCVVDGEGKRRQKNVTGLRRHGRGEVGIVARSNPHGLTAARRRPVGRETEVHRFPFLESPSISKPAQHLR